MKVFPILLAAILTTTSSAMAQGTVSIVNPSTDIAVAPGQTFLVDIQGTLDVIQLICESPLICGPVTESSGAAQWSVVVPADIRPGGYSIQAVGSQLIDRIPVLSEPRIVVVSLSTFPLSIKFDPGAVSFDYAGDQQYLRILAILSDGSKVDVSSAPETTITTSTNIFDGDAGIFTALAVGQGFITARYTANGATLSATLTTTIPQQIPGDLNGDGRVDIDDANILRGFDNHPARGANDARDLNGDGVINDQDVKILTTMCTYPKCAVGFQLNQPPAAQCQDVTVAADATCRANASVNKGSFDPDSDPITLTQSPAGPFSLGATTTTLTVTDTQGASNMCTATVRVIDRTPPSITNVSAKPNVLWPPDRKMVPITLSVSAVDNCDQAIASHCRIVSITSNEAVAGSSGRASSDWEITGPLTATLRADRSGSGSGRTYTLTTQCTDASGNATTSSTQVAVPHDQRAK